MLLFTLLLGVILFAAVCAGRFFPAAIFRYVSQILALDAPGNDDVVFDIHGPETEIDPPSSQNVGPQAGLDFGDMVHRCFLPRASSKSEGELLLELLLGEVSLEVLLIDGVDYFLLFHITRDIVHYEEWPPFPRWLSLEGFI